MAGRKRKQDAEETAGSGLLQVMTISLFIILLAFFILLNSIAVIDEQRMMKAMGSLLGSFGVMTGGYSVIEGKGDKPKEPFFETNAGQIDFSDVYIGAEGLYQEVAIQTVPRGSLVRIPTHLLFPKDGTHLTPKGRNLLYKLSNVMRKNDYPVEITAYTDNTPLAERARMSNRELTVLQALETMKYLATRAGIPAKRLTALGWGQYRPRMENSTPEGRKMNNRIEMLWVHKKKKKPPRGGFTFKNFFFKTFD